MAHNSNENKILEDFDLVVERQKNKGKKASKKEVLLVETQEDFDETVVVLSLHKLLVSKSYFYR